MIPESRFLFYIIYIRFPLPDCDFLLYLFIKFLRFCKYCMKLKLIIGIEYIFHEVTITEIGRYSVVY